MQPANILLLSKERIDTEIQIKVNFPVIFMTYFCHIVGMNTERGEGAYKLLICVKKVLKIFFLARLLVCLWIFISPRFSIMV